MCALVGAMPNHGSHRRPDDVIMSAPSIPRFSAEQRFSTEEARQLFALLPPTYPATPPSVPMDAFRSPARQLGGALAGFSTHMSVRHMKPPQKLPSGKLWQDKRAELQRRQQQSGDGTALHGRRRSPAGLSGDGLGLRPRGADEPGSSHGACNLTLAALGGSPSAAALHPVHAMLLAAAAVPDGGGGAIVPPGGVFGRGLSSPAERYLSAAAGARPASSHPVDLPMLWPQPDRPAPTSGAPCAACGPIGMVPLAVSPGGGGGYRGASGGGGSGVLAAFSAATAAPDADAIAPSVRSYVTYGGGRYTSQQLASVATVRANEARGTRQARMRRDVGPLGSGSGSALGSSSPIGSSSVIGCDSAFGCGSALGDSTVAGGCVGPPPQPSAASTIDEPPSKQRSTTCASLPPRSTSPARSRAAAAAETALPSRQPQWWLESTDETGAEEEGLQSTSESLSAVGAATLRAGVSGIPCETSGAPLDALHWPTASASSATGAVAGATGERASSHIGPKPRWRGGTAVQDTLCGGEASDAASEAWWLWQGLPNSWACAARPRTSGAAPSHALTVRRSCTPAARPGTAL